MDRFSLIFIISLIIFIAAMILSVGKSAQTVAYYIDYPSNSGPFSEPFEELE